MSASQSASRIVEAIWQEALTRYPILVSVPATKIREAKTAMYDIVYKELAIAAVGDTTSSSGTMTSFCQKSKNCIYRHGHDGDCSKK